MEYFIEQVYQEPYSILRNNCFHKSLKIVRRARELGKDADLILCWTIIRHKSVGGFPAIQPHMYAEIERQRIDVSFDPISEEKYCKNSEQIILLPLRLPKVILETIYASPKG